MGLFIGKVPLNPTISADNSFDKIVESFHNSSCKTLHPPTSQNGEVIVRPSSDMPSIKTVTATTNGFYFFQFTTEAAMEEVLESGPWLFQGQLIVLQRWQPRMALCNTEIPVWIKLQHLPMEFWTNEGLSVVASGVGKPLYPDAITKACTRLDFACVCMMLDISSTFPEHIVILMPNVDGNEVPCKEDVEYEWVQPKFVKRMCLGHSVATCPTMKIAPTKPVVVYVLKTAKLMSATTLNNKKFTIEKFPKETTVNKEQKDVVSRQPLSTASKCKELVIFYPFDALDIDEECADDLSQGPKSCNPSNGPLC
ncbi:UNVERIFIED_CONTAM: hypothetical protein Sangu_2969300 [Sesamum angustifolium]|uniref:DUF4283 domain-containing protein n=1 Tax=Sesamum angustifolium TaxID=2727405 RepID=A0AAW2IJF5_9LAMI